MYADTVWTLATAAPLDWPLSSAHSLIAPSIWRRLLMQAFCCAVARALMKLGMAIAAKRPMMATTIIISTSVKPCLREVLLVFMFSLSFIALCGVNNTTGGLFHCTFRSLIACCNRHQAFLLNTAASISLQTRFVTKPGQPAFCVNPVSVPPCARSVALKLHPPPRQTFSQLA
jgi:hypothetical protein